MEYLDKLSRGYLTVLSGVQSIRTNELALHGLK